LSLLRVCINLTNSTGEICEYLAPDMELPTLLAGIITSDPQRYSDADYRRNSKSDSDHLSATHESDHEQRESHFEVLLLSLGLMINFVQESDSTKDLVLSSPIPTSILHIFEKLLSRDVYPPKKPLLSCRADFGRNLQIMLWDTSLYYSHI
jgi:hypothetical protein